MSSPDPVPEPVTAAIATGEPAGFVEAGQGTVGDRLQAVSRAGDLVGFARLLVGPDPSGLDEAALRVLLAQTILSQADISASQLQAAERILIEIPAPVNFDNFWPANARLRARIVLGFLYRRLGREPDALEVFSEAFNWRPDIAECADCFADQLDRMGDTGWAARVRAEHAELIGQSIDRLPRWEAPAAIATGPTGLYLGLLERTLCNVIYGDGAHVSNGSPGYDPERRLLGRDLPSQAHSMIGLTRLRHLRWAVETVLAEGVAGHFIEAGVWRGGACILMAGVLAAHGARGRDVFVADSFAGLPPPDPRFAKDVATLFDFHLRPELAVGRAEVAENFRRYSLLGDNIRFVEGLFSETLPPLRHETFAVLRLDGDLYSSTMDTLQALYDSVSVGGFVICDDFGVVLDSRRAVLDFRRERGITNPMIAIDQDGIYWRK